MNTTEGNKIIAKYMDVPRTRTQFADGTYGYMMPSNLHEDELKYHKSWDWLIPVFEKIHNEHKMKIPDSPETVTNSYTRILREWRVLSFNKQSLWEAIVEFIVELNKQKDYVHV